jgi:hypothetical protein
MRIASIATGFERPVIVTVTPQTTPAADVPPFSKANAAMASTEDRCKKRKTAGLQ